MTRLECNSYGLFLEVCHSGPEILSIKFGHLHFNSYTARSIVDESVYSRSLAFGKTLVVLVQ